MRRENRNNECSKYTKFPDAPVFDKINHHCLVWVKYMAKMGKGKIMHAIKTFQNHIRVLNT